jgi:hypothetical protein
MITHEEHVLMMTGTDYNLPMARQILSYAHKQADILRQTVAICEDVNCLYALPDDEVQSDRVIMYIKPTGCGY